MGQSESISTIQLKSEDTRLSPSVNKTVEVVLDGFLGGCAAHYHAPVMARVIEISASSDMTSEYGTAATTVRAFYYALEEGRGEEAATFIVPERRRGPFRRRR